MNKLFIFLFTFTFFAVSFVAYGSGVEPESETGAQILLFFFGLIAKYPWYSVICLIVASSRFAFKPARAIIVFVIGATKTQKDDEWLRKQRMATWWRIVRLCFDTLFSIKMPEQIKKK